jgi:ABC-type amino acid transport substrate-binding protein
MKKTIATMLAVVLGVASLTACGSSAATTTTETAQTVESAAETTAAETETTVAETETTAETTETAAAAVETLQDGVLTVGSNLTFPPFEMVDDNGNPDGFDIKLIEAIAEKMGLTVEWQDMEFGALVAAIGTKIDCSIAAMTITDERKQTVDFADPYFEAVQYIVMPAGAEIKTADDLKGLTIGVQLGTTGDYAAQEIEGATVQAYDKAVYAVNDMLNGKIDCVIVDQGPAKVFEANNDGKVVAVSGADYGFEVEQYGIALPKGSALVDQINTALNELKEDGTYDALYEEYIVGYEE